MTNSNGHFCNHAVAGDSLATAPLPATDIADGFYRAGPATPRRVGRDSASDRERDLFRCMSRRDRVMREYDASFMNSATERGKASSRIDSSTAVTHGLSA